VDLTAVTRKVLADFGPSALDAGVELSLEQDGPEHIVVEAVEAAIESVLGNLVGNALIHAQGATRIMVYLKQGSVTITDNGIGLPAGQDRDLIEPFQKGQASRGAGLGLSIVQEVMLAHGGLMSVDSTPGQGTTVHLRFEQAAVRRPLSESS
jgi:signal transduction histidine kinase